MFANFDPLELRFYLFFGSVIGLAIIIAIYGTIKKWSEEKATKMVMPLLPITGILGGLIFLLPEGAPLHVILAIFIPFSILATISYVGYTRTLFEISRAAREARERRRSKQKVDKIQQEEAKNN